MTENSSLMRCERLFSIICRMLMPGTGMSFLLYLTSFKLQQRKKGSDGWCGGTGPGDDGFIMVTSEIWLDCDLLK